jgi:hypothetical protein
MVQVPEASPQVLAPAAAASTVSGQPAVKWLSVRQLLTTALEVVQASMFARFADKREAMANCPREFYRLFPDDAPPTVWVDFVADTGDGFTTTFATARCLAGEPGLQVGTTRDRTEFVDFGDRPPRAQLLVMGGDEVYPVASVSAYLKRLNAVFAAAAQRAGATDLPPVVALPGNHDWYDGLTAFRRNFCESWVSFDRPVVPGGVVLDVPPPACRDDLGGWGAFQSRSYFAVQLSEKWWLWGVDSQLDAAVDAEQLAYFNQALTHLGDANLILCTATPCWLEADTGNPYRAEAETPLFTLLWFIDRVLGPAHRDRLRVLLTGDKHHYAHYAPIGDGPELVTCGGGGAFLSSTHHLPDDISFAWQPWADEQPKAAYTRVKEYPSQQESKDLLKGGKYLAAAWRNGWGFPALTGVANALLFLAILVHRPLWITLGALVFAGLLVPYAASGIKGHLPGWPRRFALPLLALGHLVLHAAPAVLVAALVFRWQFAGHSWLTYLLTAAGAIVVGTAAFLTYIRLADLFSYHTLEAFSSLRFERYKCHLRLEVTDEHVKIHAIGLDTPTATLEPYRLEEITVPYRAPAGG